MKQAGGWMGIGVGITNFGVVVAGVNLPADKFDLSALRFRRQPFKELFRAPVALQAEASGAQMQIVPDRFEVIVASPDDVRHEASEIQEISNSIFDYIGPKSIRAVGHNMQYIMDSTRGHKMECFGELINTGAVQSAIGTDLRSADLALVFRLTNESQTRATILGHADEERLVVDFNMNFEGAQLLSARSTLNQLGSSLEVLTELARRIETSLTGGNV